MSTSTISHLNARVHGIEGELGGCINKMIPLSSQIGCITESEFRIIVVMKFRSLIFNLGASKYQQECEF